MSLKVVDKLRDLVNAVLGVRTVREVVLNALVGAVTVTGSVVGYQAAVGAFGAISASVTERMVFPAYAAQVEQLRKDAAVVPCASSAMVMDRVVGWNVNIAFKQQLNRGTGLRVMWDWMVPDGWNGVEMIRPPCQEAEE